MIKTLAKRFLKFFLIFFLSTSFLSVILLRWVPVYITPLMAIRCVQQKIEGRDIKMVHHWVPKEKISKDLPNAVIASEDNLFTQHHGFDFEAIQSAAEEIKQGTRMRGGSTISQQTAKNVFLWPSSSWVRKGFEAYFTLLIEIFWDKERIMEVYLNSIEMGDGIYGAEAVAQEHFGTTAEKLSRRQCALIAATLPNPLKFDSAHPSGYMLKRQGKILRLMKVLPHFPPAKID